jgi:hypothetical protein
MHVDSVRRECQVKVSRRAVATVKGSTSESAAQQQQQQQQQPTEDQQKTSTRPP